MAVPGLVYCPAGDNYKRYPGEFFAVCAADFLATGRGTLSTEADALSAAGTVVRDTQTVSNIRSNSNTAYQAADDTLAITGLPLTTGSTYHVYVTHRIEGYTDITDGPLLRTGFNENWLNAMVYGAHTTSEASNIRAAATPPPFEYYRASYLGEKSWSTGNTWFIRFAAESGTSIEILIDQIFIFRKTTSSSLFPMATNTTFETVAATQDGADGGDANGKFTWMARNPPDAWSSRGDYQRVVDGDDAEYFSEVTTADGLTFWVSGDELASSAWMYSLHTANHRGERTWTDDTFANRTTSGQDMGITPEGFGYRIGSSANVPPNEAFVNGAGQAILRVGQVLGTIQVDLGNATTGTGTSNQGMKFQLYDQFSWDMVWQWTDGTDADAYVRLYLEDGTFWSSAGLYLEFDIPGGTWRMVHPVTGPGTDHDISAWFGFNALVGVRIELKRYLLRSRVWDASGAEPGTWDESQFLEYAGAGATAYPYGDVEAKSTRINAPFVSLNFYLEHLDAFAVDLPFEITLHKNTVEHDPYGDPESMFARIERPAATSLGDIEIPFGSSYWVYWGRRDWTDTFAGNDYLSFSTRVWNDPAAAEIQRAEVGDYYFYWFLGDTIVSMNWRSAQSPHVTHVYS